MREAAGELTRRVEIGLQQVLRPGAPFQRAYFEPMMSIGHARNTFDYILGQLTRHGVDVDRCHDASNGPDLIGARLVGTGTALVVRRHFPRIRRADIVRALGISDPKGAPYEPYGFADAAAAAIGRAALEGRTSDVIAGRVAVAHLADRLTPAMLANELGVSVRTAHRLRCEEPSHLLMGAIRQQLVLRQSAPLRAEPRGVPWADRRQ